MYKLCSLAIFVHVSLGIVLSSTQHAQMAIPVYTVNSALISVIRKNAKVPATNLWIDSNRYLCIRKNYITMRGLIVKPDDFLATAVRDTLSTWLREQGSSLILGNRQVGIRAGLCGLALSTVNDTVCGRDYPTLSSRSSSPDGDVESLKISLVSVCFVSGGLVIVITILVVYTLYRKRRNKR